MGGRLEHEIRLLPQVLSCSFSNDDYVVVLVHPSADPHRIQLAVERILQNAGSEATVRVVGPPQSVATAATATITPFVATATVATVAAIGVGSLVGGVAAAQHPQKPVVQHRAPSGAGERPPTDSIDALRRLQISVASPPAESIPPTVKSRGRPSVMLPVSHGTAAEAVSITRAVPPIGKASGKSTSGKFASGSTAPGSTASGSTASGSNESGSRSDELGTADSDKGPPAWSHPARHSEHDQRRKGKGR